MRLSYGEIDWPNEDARRLFVRNLFLDAVGQHAPEVCEYLYTKILPLYRAAQATAVETRDEHGDRQWVPQTAEGHALANALLAWTKTYNLTDSWCRDAAIKVLPHWSAFKAKPAKLDLLTMPTRALLMLQPLLRDGATGPAVNLPPAPEGLRDYDPLTQTREEYLKGQSQGTLIQMQSSPPLAYGENSIQKALADSISSSRVITDYCAAVEDAYVEKGYVRRNPDEKRHLATHLKWTVRHRVLGQTFSRIAAKSGVNKENVSRAVRQINSLIA